MIKQGKKSNAQIYRRCHVIARCNLRPTVNHLVPLHKEFPSLWSVGGQILGNLWGTFSIGWKSTLVSISKGHTPLLASWHPYIQRSFSTIYSTTFYKQRHIIIYPSVDCHLQISFSLSPFRRMQSGQGPSKTGQCWIHSRLLWIAWWICISLSNRVQKELQWLTKLLISLKLRLKSEASFKLHG